MSGVVAVLAPFISCIQFMPQLYKTFTTKKVKGLSLVSLGLMTTSSFLWLIHGYFILDISLLVGGVIAVSVNTLLIILYFLYRRRSR